MRQTIYIFLIVLFSTPLLVEGKDKEIDEAYPGKARLFYVERSKNRNIVCYDANLIGMDINSSDPVYVYWINKEEHPGERNGLSLIQRRLAFGYKIKSKKPNDIRIELNATNKKQIEIIEKNGTYCSIVEINSEQAVLDKIYVKTKDSNSLSVEYIEMFGKNMNGDPISEKIYPD